MAETHTPGPWTWFDYPDGRKLLCATNRAVIHCPDAPMACDPPDARVITTAPDGLALAVAIIDYFGDKPIDPLLTTDIMLRDMARAIVAKAEGR